MSENSTDEDERRRWSRRTVLWPAILDCHGNEQTAWVRNVSVAGFGVQSALPLALQTAVSVALERYGRFEGFVVWQQGRLAGIAFVEPPEAIRKRFGADAATFGLT